MLGRELCASLGCEMSSYEITGVRAVMKITGFLALSCDVNAGW